MAFQKAAGLRFHDPGLLNLAFVHRSLSNEAGHQTNNERLEFLGDSIVGAVAATLLYERFAGRPEGELAKIKSVVVSEEALSGIARELQIDSLLLLGKGEDQTGGRTKPALLADAFEALVGACYLDCGYKSAFTFAGRFIGAEISRVAENRHHQDYKSLLQEFCQRRYRNYPCYQVDKRAGPEHERFFWISVTVNGTAYGPGMGRSKKAAEQEAARLAWEAVGGNI
ncbi:MAG: ribonuclease III [Treponema sp.]|jgi:ribonuclease-3|nr:ribonuclease III [Treponema sp.]